MSAWSYETNDYAARENWADAACRGRTAEMVMPGLVGLGTLPRYNSGGQIHRVRVGNAKAICAGCPMLQPCRAWALTSPDPCHILVAGGMTPAERSIARQR